VSHLEANDPKLACSKALINDRTSSSYSKMEISYSATLI